MQRGAGARSWVPLLVLAGLGCGGVVVAPPDGTDVGEAAEADGRDRGDGETRDDARDRPGDVAEEDGAEPEGDGGEDSVDAEGTGPGCGNGVVEGGEECDDGNRDDTDDCPTTCLDARCGDGFTWHGREDCDDGNDDDTDDCPGTCEEARCGDGFVREGREECDDGNGDDADDCPRTCEEARCGDGFVREGREECDDGNTRDEDDCVAGCRDATCGDGFVWAGHEECDEGEENSDTEADRCRLDCRPWRCGDGVVDTGEGCDDGNTDETDSCRNDCSPASCGDHVVQDGEECDDGNEDDTDSCLHTCRNARCGDGYVRAGVEACDGRMARECMTECGTEGSQVCTALCSWPTACTPPAEACNAADDDCDRLVDEDYLCIRGEPLSCTTTCSSAGTGTCSDECMPPAGPDCLPPGEECNGLDDDCDTVADNGYECAWGETETCTVGACTGTRFCDTTTCTWWESCSFGAIPLHDNCTMGGPVTIPPTLGSATFSGSNCGARDDYDYACSAADDPMAGPDVLYGITLTAARLVTIDGTGSSFPVALVLLAGTSCPGSAIVACAPPGSDGSSATISRVLEAGTYFLIVDSMAYEARGPFQLNVTFAEPPPPPNDNCTHAQEISLASELRGTEGTTSGAVDDHESCRLVGGSTAPDVWYRFQLANASVVYLSTLDGHPWDSVLEVHQAPCPGTAVLAGCADDACSTPTGGWTPRSQFAGVLPPGTYFVVIDGYNTGDRGPFRLHYQAADCSPLDGDPGIDGVSPFNPNPSTGYRTLNGWTTGGADRTRGSCAGTSSTPAPDVLYYSAFCPGQSLAYTTCGLGTNFDTVLYARYGHCMATTEVACNNDFTCLGPSGTTGASVVTVSPPDQGLVFLWVDGYSGASGNFELTVSFPP